MRNKEKKAIDELRKRMKGEMEEDMYEDIDVFYRFLKARDFNVSNAEDMLRKHLEWRKKVDLKNILLPQIIEKYFPYSYLGFDKEGCTVRYVAVGGADLIGLGNSVTPEEAEQGVAYLIEEDIARQKNDSRNLTRHTIKCSAIYNLEHFPLRMLTHKKILELLFTILRSFEKNYPERLKKLYIINASSYISIICNIFKSVMAVQTLKKMHFYSDDNWKEAILNDVDANVLPAFLGGNRTDPDGNPLCYTFINHGKKVPERYYLTRTKRLLYDAEGVKQMILSSGSSYEEIFEVSDAGVFLEWEFETVSGDIAFGLFYKERSNGEERRIELIPLRRTASKDSLKRGSYLCDKIGKYIFLFDNSFSWIRSKEINYRIKIRSPAEEVHE